MKKWLLAKCFTAGTGTYEERAYQLRDNAGQTDSDPQDGPQGQTPPLTQQTVPSVVKWYGSRGSQQPAATNGPLPQSNVGTQTVSPEKWRQLLRLLAVYGSKGSTFEQLHKTVALTSATTGLMISVTGVALQGRSFTCLAAAGPGHESASPGMTHFMEGHTAMATTRQYQVNLSSVKLPQESWPQDWSFMHENEGLQTFKSLPVLTPEGVVGMLTAASPEVAALDDPSMEVQLETLSAWCSRLFQDGQLTDYCNILEDILRVPSITGLLKVITHHCVRQQEQKLYSGKVHCRIAIISTDGMSAMLFDDLNTEVPLSAADQHPLLRRKSHAASALALATMHDMGPNLMSGPPRKGTADLLFTHTKQPNVPASPPLPSPPKGTNRRASILMGPVEGPEADGFASTVKLTESHLSPAIPAHIQHALLSSTGLLKELYQSSAGAHLLSTPVLFPPSVPTGLSQTGHSVAPTNITTLDVLDFSTAGGLMASQPGPGGGTLNTTNQTNMSSGHNHIVEGTVVKLEGTALGEAVQTKQGVWVQDCAAFMQDRNNPNTDVFLATTSQDSSGSLVINVMYQDQQPVLALYLTLSQRYSPEVLQNLSRSVSETLSVLQPLICAKLTGDLLEEWTYMQTTALEVTAPIKKARRASVDMTAVMLSAQNSLAHTGLGSSFGLARTGTGSLASSVKPSNMSTSNSVDLPATRELSVTSSHQDQTTTSMDAGRPHSSLQKQMSSNLSPTQAGRSRKGSQHTNPVQALLRSLRSARSVKPDSADSEADAPRPGSVHWGGTARLGPPSDGSTGPNSASGTMPSWPAISPCASAGNSRSGSVNNIPLVPDAPRPPKIAAARAKSFNACRSHSTLMVGEKQPDGKDEDSDGLLERIRRNRSMYNMKRLPLPDAIESVDSPESGLNRTKPRRPASFRIASSQGSSSGKRMSALITGLQDRVQEAQRLQLNQRALVPRTQDLLDITIVSRIGTGGFSACYLAIYQGAQVALKVIHERNGTEVELFRNAVELAVMSTLSHPNIVQVLTFFTDVGVSYPTYEARMSGDVPPLILHSAETPSHLPSTEGSAVKLTQLSSPQHAHAIKAPGDLDREMLKAIGIRATEVDQMVGSPTGATAAVSPPKPAAKIQKAVVICMEYCDAGTLWEAIRAGAFQDNRQGMVIPDWPKIYQTLLELASALRYLHSLMLVHRDLKPQNVLLKVNISDPRGFTVKLSDFGLTKLCNQNQPPRRQLTSNSDLTNTIHDTLSLTSTHNDLAANPSELASPNAVGSLAGGPSDNNPGNPGNNSPGVPQPAPARRRRYSGTVTHLPPEIFNQTEEVDDEVDASADIYAFGILMWELAMSQPVYGFMHSEAIITRVVHSAMRPEFGPNIPSEYRELAARCWHSEPRARPSAESLVHTLNGLLTASVRNAPRTPRLSSRMSLLSGASSAPLFGAPPTPPAGASGHHPVPQPPAADTPLDMHDSVKGPNSLLANYLQPQPSPQYPVNMQNPAANGPPDTDFPLHIL